MFAILAAALVLSPATPAPVVRPVVTAPVAQADETASVAVSPLPGIPRNVKLTSDGNMLTWDRPARQGSTPLTGYVVIIGEKATYVSASTFAVAVPSNATRIAIAAMNGVGCSVVDEVDIPASRPPRLVAVASK